MKPITRLYKAAMQILEEKLHKKGKLEVFQIES